MIISDKITMFRNSKIINLIKKEDQIQLNFQSSKHNKTLLKRNLSNRFHWARENYLLKNIYIHPKQI